MDDLVADFVTSIVLQVQHMGVQFKYTYFFEWAFVVIALPVFFSFFFWGGKRANYHPLQPQN